MTLCDDGHDEVCFEGRTCPCCYVMKEKEDEIDGLNRDISSLESEVRDLESQLEEKE